MIELDLQENKVKTLFDFIYKERGELGGYIMQLIIPPNYKDLMDDMSSGEEESDFYFLGYYHQFKFKVYVDKSLTDCMYLVCNDGIAKVKFNG